MTDARRRDALLFSLLAAVWGTAFVAIKVGLAAVPPVSLAALRYDLAAVLVVAYAGVAADRWLPRTRDDALAVLVSGTLVIAAYNAFLFVGERTVTSAVAAIVVGLSPILTVVFSRSLLPRERLGPVGVLGLGLGLAGVIAVARPWATGGAGPLAVGQTRGALLVLLAAASVALGSVLVRRIDAGIETEGLVAWSNVVGAICLHAAALALPGESLVGVDWTPATLAAVGYLAVVASAMGYVLYFDLLDRLGPVEINLVSYAAPVFAAVAGFALLAEPITAPAVAGFLSILAGFALVKRDAIWVELGRRIRDAE